MVISGFQNDCHLSGVGEKVIKESEKSIAFLLNGDDYKHQENEERVTRIQFAYLTRISVQIV